MSHVVDIKAEINDLDALAAAAEQCGMELERNGKTFKWYGTHVGDYPLPAGFSKADMGKCEHRIRIRGASEDAYEIGVVRRRGEGATGYTLLFDFWQGGFGLRERAGENCGLLLQEYAAAVVERNLSSRHRIVRERLENGKLRLRIRA